MPPLNSTTISDPTDFLLVIPAYRELKRLPSYLAALSEALAGAPWTTAILVVDDGSPPAERRALFDQIKPGLKGRCQVLAPRHLEKNHLKGDAIIEGWKSHSSRWMAYADADGATSAVEVLRVFSRIFAEDPSSTTAYFGSRYGAPLHGKRTFVRRSLSRAFSILTGWLLRVPSIDIQCGFKVVPGQALSGKADQLTGRGLCFDVALYLLLRAARVPVRPVPIDWIDQPGGKVSALRNGPGMLSGLLRLAVGGVAPRQGSKSV